MKLAASWWRGFAVGAGAGGVVGGVAESTGARSEDVAEEDELSLAVGAGCGMGGATTEGIGAGGGCGPGPGHSWRGDAQANDASAITMGSDSFVVRIVLFT